IQPPLHPSRPSNMLELVAHFSLLRTYPSHAEEKVSMLPGAESRPPWDGREHSIVRIQAHA
ncbi:unnamed protein product, partial [Musa acuminata subsp. burmannicoides]